jgi:hypothetical protein
MLDGIDVLFFIFIMPLCLLGYVVGNYLDNNKNIQDNKTIKEWKDTRPTSCKLNHHNFFRDSQYERHCLNCNEHQTFIAGIGVADWSVDSQPMLENPKTL